MFSDTKMEQVFMIEVFVKKIILKLEPPVKDEWELAQEEEERRKEAERLAALEAAAALKKGKKGKKAKPKKKGKKGKGKKGPAGPSEEELKYMKTCTLQMNCLPIFDFYVAHDNFVAPPPPPPPPKKGKKGKKAKPKKGKKGKKPAPFKVQLPSEPLPEPPFFGVGNSVIFISRPSKLEELMMETPIYITVWNRDQDMNCIGFCVVNWHTSFMECLKKSADLNPLDMDAGEFRNTAVPEIVTNTVEYTRPLQCEENLAPSGLVDFYVKLTCLGNKVLTHFIALPEMERLPGRKYLVDDFKLKDVEVVRHWLGTDIDTVPPVAYFFSGPDIIREPIIPVETEAHFEDYKCDFTDSDLAILSMGFPKGPCGGTNCPRRLEYRGSQHEFVSGDLVKGKWTPGSFVNSRDVHGPCGRLDCALAKKVRKYLCKEGVSKPCQKPCMTSFN